MALSDGGYVQLKISQIERFNMLYMDAHKEAFAAAETEYQAAIIIQRYWRGCLARKRINTWQKLATRIQRLYRGWLGRKEYRKQLVLVLARLEEEYYNTHARRIQALWRGFYSRKHISNYYARQAYLRAVEEKNEIMRATLRKIEQEDEARKEQKRLLDAKAKEEAFLRQAHHQLSTVAMTGVYAQADKVEGNSRTLRRTEVHAGYASGTLQATLAATLRARTAIPPAATPQDSGCERILTKPLPSVQGPFRNPADVQTIRNRPLRPTLRVQTDFSNPERELEKKRREDDEDAVRKLHATTFQPFSLAHNKEQSQHQQTVRSGAAYTGLGPGDTRLAYGTSTFREDGELPHLPRVTKSATLRDDIDAQQQKKSTQFKTVVRPLVYFDNNSY